MAYHYSLDDVGTQVSELEDSGRVGRPEVIWLIIALALIERLEEIDKSLDVLGQVLSTK